jgi:hypothetical protein
VSSPIDAISKTMASQGLGSRVGVGVRHVLFRTARIKERNNGSVVGDADDLASLHISCLFVCPSIRSFSDLGGTIYSSESGSMLIHQPKLMICSLAELLSIGDGKKAKQ